MSHWGIPKNTLLELLKQFQSNDAIKLGTISSSGRVSEGGLKGCLVWVGVQVERGVVTGGGGVAELGEREYRPWRLRVMGPAGHPMGPHTLFIQTTGRCSTHHTVIPASQKVVSTNFWPKTLVLIFDCKADILKDNFELNCCNFLILTLIVPDVFKITNSKS